MVELKFSDFFEESKKLKNGRMNLIILDIPWGIFGPNGKHPDIQWDHRPSLKKLGVIARQLLDEHGYITVFGDRNLITAIGESWSDILTLRDELIWVKPGNLPTNTLKPLPVHEFIHVYMRKDIRMNKCTWNPRVLPGKPYVRRGTPGSISTRRQIKSARHENTTGMRHLKSVIPAPNKPAMKDWERKGMQHPTMKPVQLLSQIIRAYSNPGDMVLDPFSGSASTALTCFLTGRDCVSYENDNIWFYQSVMRLNRVKAMLGPGQVRELLEQPEKGIDEFDLSVLYC